MFSNEIAIRGKHYQTKITVLGDDLEKSKLFFSEFILRFASDREKFAEEMDNVKNKFERFGSLYQIQQEQTPNSQQQASNMLISGNAQSDLIKKKLKQSNNSTAEQPSKDKLAVESDKLNNFGQIRRLKVMTEKPNFNEIIDIDQYVIKQYHFKVVDEYFDTINEAGAIQGDSIMGDDLSLQISQFGNAKSNNKVINGFGSPISKPISFESQNSVLYKSKIHEEQQNYSIFKKKTGNQYDFNEVTNKNEQIPIPQKLQQDNKLSTLVFDKIESVQITDIQKQQDQEQDVIIQETGSQRENNELNQQQVNLSQNNFVKYLDSTKRDYETDRQLIQELVEQQEKGLKVDDNLITQKDKTFIENHDNSYISKQKENILYEEDQDKSQLGYSVNALNPQQSKLNNHSYFNYS
ncbi:hypothetical protein ABPG73_008763 [Tetrahymena malaccensis]